MSLKQKTILVVDDDEDMLKLLERILSTAGFRVLQSKNPADARKILEVDPPHVILSDLHMEPENGFRFIQSIRSQKQYAAVPILVLSALKDFHSVKKAIALGINDYVIKPLQAPMLLRKLRKALLNKDFVKWDIPDSQEITVSVLIDAQVSAIGETGCNLKGPFKISAGKEIRILTPEFSSMELENIVQKATQNLEVYQSGGHFINDITFVGISEAAASKIRQYVAKRNF
jgi:two-component system chemotaxis response regulator CheY